jgi:hypothetical protein
MRNDINGELVLERLNTNAFRQNGIERNYKIKSLRLSKREVPHESIIVRAIRWLDALAEHGTMRDLDFEDVETLRLFPGTFL